MNSYFEVLDKEGNLISIVRKNSCGIIEVYKLESGITSFIKQGILLCKKDKHDKIIYPAPSDPVCTQEELKSSSSSIF
jgi:hypothetical protein